MLIVYTQFKFLYIPLITYVPVERLKIGNQFWRILQCINTFCCVYMVFNWLMYHVGFTSPLMACCGFGGPPYNYNIQMTCGQPGAQVCNEGTKFVSWDGIHYSEAANNIVASNIQSNVFSTPHIAFDFFCHWNLFSL